MFVLNKRQGNFVYRKKKYTLIILKIDHQNKYIITKKVIFDNNLNPSIYQEIEDPRNKNIILLMFNDFIYFVYHMST